MDAVISKGIILSYAESEGVFKALDDMQEIPELGKNKDKIEITTLQSPAHEYTDGLDNYGDSLGFKFLYKTEQFNMLAAFTGSKQWRVTLPDGTTCTFGGSSSVKLDGVGVNAALTYTLSITPNSEMVWGTAE